MELFCGFRVNQLVYTVSTMKSEEGFSLGVLVELVILANFRLSVFSAHFILT